MPASPRRSRVDPVDPARRFLQLTDDIAGVAGFDGRLIETNPALDRLLAGAPATDLRSCWQHAVHADDRRLANDLWTALVTGADPVVGGELRLRGADGTWRWFSVSAIADAETRRVSAIAKDVTERRGTDERFRAAFEHAAIGMTLMDAGGVLQRVNAAFGSMLGRSPEQLTGRHIQDFVHPEDLPRDRVAVAAMHSGESDVHRVEKRYVRADGEVVWTAASLTALRGPDGSAQQFISQVIDVSERRAAELALAASERRFRSLAASSPTGIFSALPDGRTTYVNERFAELFELGEDERIGLAWLSRVHPEDRAAFVERTVEAVALRQPVNAETRILRRAGDVRWLRLSVAPVADEADGALQYVGTIEDVTDHRRAAAELTHQALHDALTGLPNRALFLDRLTQALARGRRRGTGVGVLFLDLDRFKVVNDSLGHSAGDRLLIDVATRLSDGLRPSDTLARFGGDELTVLCEDLNGQEDAQLVAERLLERFGEPFVLSEGEVFLDASIGIALSPKGGERPEDLIRDADAAMYRAKERGKARVEIFDDDMRRVARERLATESALRRALDRGELRIFYQSIVDLATLRVEGFEALVRWEHPQRGLLGPAAFVELAEEIGLIGRIDRWVLEQGCRQLGRWQLATGRSDLALSVNLSPRQLVQPDLVPVVGEALSAGGVRPGQLVIEITERTVMEVGQATADTLDALKGLGVRLAIDDFGTGYSSLAHLRSFPVDVLKIDRGFTADLGHEGREGTIAAAILSLGRALGLRTVAEGIERLDQLEALLALGCPLGQGYHFSRPLPADEATAVLLASPRA
jgi:diguanylate cyclase (GGDEF)-like protein/PAS domain S-box-containing protein